MRSISFVTGIRNNESCEQRILWCVDSSHGHAREGTSGASTSPLERGLVPYFHSQPCNSRVHRERRMESCILGRVLMTLLAVVLVLQEYGAGL